MTRRNVVGEVLDVLRAPGGVDVSALAPRFAAMTFAELADFDRRSRSGWVELRSGWSRLSPADVTSWTDGMWPLLACASSHANGHVREAAVHRLLDVGPPAAFPFLVLRTSDWVPAIAARALAGVLERLTADHAGEAMNVVAYLRQPRRGGLGNLYNAVSAFVTSPEPRVRRAFREALLYGTHATRRGLAPLLPAIEGRGGEDLLRDASLSPDPRVATEATRLRIAHAKAGAIPVVVRLALATELTTSRHPQVRVQALHEQVDLAITALDLERILRPAFLDRSADVRELARFVVKQRRLAIDPLAIATAALHQATRAADVARAIGIVRESGETRADVFRAYAASASPAVRNAAYVALSKIGVTFDEDELLALLAGPSRRLARTAKALIGTNVFDGTKRKLTALAADGVYDHTRRFAAALLRALPENRGYPR